MRLDRILVQEGSKIKPKNIQIDFNIKIPRTLFLYPSDHFGLTLTYEVTNRPNRTKHSNIIRKVLNKNETGFRKPEVIKRYRIGAIIIMAMLIVFILLFCLIKYLYWIDNLMSDTTTAKFASSSLDDYEFGKNIIIKVKL
jgi:hypothetical protein